VGTSPSGIGYSLERAEVIAKDNKYQLKDSFTEILKHLLLLMSYGWEVEFLILAFRKSKDNLSRIKIRPQSVLLIMLGFSMAIIKTLIPVYGPILNNFK